MNVPYVNLPAQHAPIKDKLLAAVAQVLDHGQFILSDEVTEFENRFAELCGVSYAVGVNSGTDALILALKALGIGPGDEVITVPNSFVASTGCIMAVGAQPVFVDVRDDFNIDPTLIEPAITNQTKAILPVHLTGRPAAMDTIVDLAKAYGLFVVEDAAQAVGARFNGRPVGSWGNVGCFSLHPLKTLNACGDGGVLTTDDPGLFEEFKVWRNIGLRSRDDCVLWGHNSRLDSIQAAMLLVKMQFFGNWTERRRANACFYQERMAAIPQVQIPVDLACERSVYHTFVIQASRRDELKAYLAERDIGTAIHYAVPIHLQAAAAGLGYQSGSFPVTEKQAGRILSLPVHSDLEPDQMDYVVDCMQEYFSGFTC